VGDLLARATPTLCVMELTEIVFTLASKEDAERLSGHLRRKGLCLPRIG
jgi:hypothetical protein